jgi:uncharacterized protein DUF6459
MSTELTGSAGVPPATGERDQPGTLSGAPTVLPLVPGITRRPRGKRRPPGKRPLPDAVAVRMLAIPDSAPPYDDEASPGAPAPAALGGMLPPRAGQPERAGQAPPGGQAQQAGQAPPGGQVPGPRRAVTGSRAGSQAAPPGWPGTFAQVLAETLAGARPPRQIVPWTTERARRHIQRLGPLLAAREQPRVRRVVTFRPAAGVVEMTVIVGVGPRVRALAVRLERAGPRQASPGRDAQAARWVCTAVEAA